MPSVTNNELPRRCRATIPFTFIKTPAECTAAWERLPMGSRDSENGSEGGACSTTTSASWELPLRCPAVGHGRFEARIRRLGVAPGHRKEPVRLEISLADPAAYAHPVRLDEDQQLPIHDVTRWTNPSNATRWLSSLTLPHRGDRHPPGLREDALAGVGYVAVLDHGSYPRIGYAFNGHELAGL